jgi:hypothetical protein
MFSRKAALPAALIAGILVSSGALTMLADATEPAHGGIVDRTLHHSMTIPTDLKVVCLWSLLGLALTSLFLGMGFGAVFAQALMAAG